MHKVLILGSGMIGRTIANYLLLSNGQNVSRTVTGGMTGESKIINDDLPLFDVTVADKDVSALDRISIQSNKLVETWGEECALKRCEKVDATDAKQLREVMKGHDSVVSASPHELNLQIAEAAIDGGLNYFDLTEDNKDSEHIRLYAASDAHSDNSIVPWAHRSKTAQTPDAVVIWMALQGSCSI